MSKNIYKGHGYCLDKFKGARFWDISIQRTPLGDWVWFVDFGAFRFGKLK